jgi:hypothetical protein
MSINQRKQRVIKSLNSIGESNWAKDFVDATGPDAYQTLENIMRESLKVGGMFRTVKWTKAVGNAIVECQCIPAIARHAPYWMAAGESL